MAVTSAQRRRGLLGRDSLRPGEGLYLTPCEWIHTFGMRFPIDVAFLAGDGKVVAVHRSLRPGRVCRIVLRADGVLELPSGMLEATGTAVGDIIQLQHSPAPADHPG